MEIIFILSVVVFFVVLAWYRQYERKKNDSDNRMFWL